MLEHVEQQDDVELELGERRLEVERLDVSDDDVPIRLSSLRRCYWIDVDAPHPATPFLQRASYVPGGAPDVEYAAPGGTASTQCVCVVRVVEVDLTRVTQSVHRTSSAARS